MCGLYGVLSYGNEIKDMAEITEALAVESAVRGTDATGIAYNKRGHMTVFKKSKSAYEMKFSVPKGVNVVMGHTRHATQGTLKYNANNHPFKGICGGKEFALAHNGILCNDTALRRELRLPSTRIETDSYIAVQILESQKQLDFKSIKYMAEKVEGSYSFTILDNKNNLYIVKGDSPISLLHFPKKKVYIYLQQNLNYFFHQSKSRNFYIKYLSQKCLLSYDSDCNERKRFGKRYLAINIDLLKTEAKSEESKIEHFFR